MIQYSQESLRALARRHGVKQKAVAKWRKRSSTADLRTEQGKLYLLVAIDRTAKFAFVELHEKATRRIAGDFVRHLAAVVPYRIHTVLTNNLVLSKVEGGTHFTDPTGDSWTPEDIKEMRAQKLPFRCHAFEAAPRRLRRRLQLRASPQDPAGAHTL